MMSTGDHASWGYAASTGLGFTQAEIVEAHFAACAPYYRAALDQVGIEPGWRVLDAGCGSGGYLPWLAELVGADGAVSGIDLAPENAALAKARPMPDQSRVVPDIRQGNVLDLPYPDDAFDAAWCANTTQYLDDAELERALRELRRVVRPGGHVAVKDLDPLSIVVRPGDPFLFGDFFRVAGEQPGYARQLLRTRELYRWLDEAGLCSVRQRTFVMEHVAPLEPHAERFYGIACAQVAKQAVSLGLAGRWEPFVDPAGADNPLRQLHGYISEGTTVAVGVVPEN